MATNNDTEFKFDELTGLETSYICMIRLWLQYAEENRTCNSGNPHNSKLNLNNMLEDFFIKPKFAFYKSQALYNTFTGVLKKPLMDWKLADEEWFTKLDTYYKKLLINSKLQQLEGDFKDGN